MTAACGPAPQPCTACHDDGIPRTDNHARRYQEAEGTA